MKDEDCLLFQTSEKGDYSLVLYYFQRREDDSKSSFCIGFDGDRGSHSLVLNGKNRAAELYNGLLRKMESNDISGLLFLLKV